MSPKTRKVRGALVAVMCLIALAAGWKYSGLSLPHGPAAPDRSIEIGYIGSESADEYSSGQVVDNHFGASFAITRLRSVRGFTLKLVPLDDVSEGAWSGDKAAVDMQQLISTNRVLGVVGPQRGPEARAAAPDANRAHLAMISPSITDPCVTEVHDYCESANGPQIVYGIRPTGVNNFFRIAAAETHLGPAMAHFAFERLGLREVAVWDDSVRMVEADGFSDEFVRLGGVVVDRSSFDVRESNAPDFRPWLRRAKADGAQAIYAGAWEHACAARSQSQGIFDPSSYYLGPDGVPDLFSFGMADQDCVDEAGTMANDRMYAIRGVGHAILNTSAAATVAAYSRAYPDSNDINVHTFADYDCVAILVDAIGRAIDADGGSMPTRQQVVDQLARTKDFKGLTGTYSFGPMGDPTRPTLQVLQYETSGWLPITNLTVSD